MTVLLSIPPDTATSVASPWFHLLEQSMSAYARFQRFTWRTALLGRFDVFALQWPESLVRGKTPLRSFAKAALVVAFVARMKLLRRPIVRTMHNLAPHEPATGLESLILRFLASSEDVRVYMTETSRAEANDTEGVIIKHGHYRDWYETKITEQQMPTTRRPDILLFGMLRPYKGPESLIEAFKATTLHAQLVLAGKPLTVEYGQSLQALTSDDERIKIDPRYIPDGELWEMVTAATLVVIPYAAVTNSGTLIAALDAETPVLLPASAMAEEFATECGSKWVMQYTGELTPDKLASAYNAATQLVATGERPSLVDRDWATIGRQYCAVYAAAIAAKRGQSSDHIETPARVGTN
jgi:glycosyltransferase involved in cell wall biosynthesis